MSKFTYKTKNPWIVLPVIVLWAILVGLLLWAALAYSWKATLVTFALIFVLNWLHIGVGSANKGFVEWLLSSKS